MNQLSQCHDYVVLYQEWLCVFMYFVTYNLGRGRVGVNTCLYALWLDFLDASFKEKYLMHTDIMSSLLRTSSVLSTPIIIEWLVIG